MKIIKNIIIANDTEAFAGIIKAIKNPAKRIEKIDKEDFLCGRFLLWENDNKVIITPRKIQEEIIEQIRLLGQKSIENWFPKKVTTNLSQAICEDRPLFEKLKKAIKQNPKVILSPYCYTSEFSRLVKKLRDIGLRFEVDQQSIDRSSSIVSYLGSKTGFRNELQKINEHAVIIPQPNFFIHDRIGKIYDSVGRFYKGHMSCVIKTNSGEGGWGVLFVQPNKFNTKGKLFTWLGKEFRRDSIWRHGPYLVEEFINSDGGTEHSPSLEIFIHGNKPLITYACNQVVDRNGRFIGVFMGKDCLNANTENRIRRIGKTIGRRYANLGYRGFFDIDFIVSPEGRPYPIETNVRRTGGTHVFDFVHWFFGPKWYKKIVALSSDSFEYGVKTLSARNILHKIGPLRFPMNNSKEGVIIAAIASTVPVFSYIIIGSNKKRALEIREKLIKIFPYRYETDNA